MKKNKKKMQCISLLCQITYIQEKSFQLFNTIQFTLCKFANYRSRVTTHHLPSSEFNLQHKLRQNKTEIVI